MIAELATADAGLPSENFANALLSRGGTDKAIDTCREALHSAPRYAIIGEHMEPGPS